MSARDRKMRLAEALQRAERAERQEREMRSRLAAAEAARDEVERSLDAVGHALGICYDHEHGCGGHGPVANMVLAAKDGCAARGDAIDTLVRAEAAESREAALREALERLVAAFDGGYWTACATSLKHAREALASPRTTPPEAAPEAKQPNRCDCGEYALHEWCGTYSVAGTDHTRERCVASPPAQEPK